ncbi:acyltransferase domain-containing protein [Streptomyces sp. Z26]|uniref:acyltransferase domain-containing protein n=1 Tax=Streptomyces sp. Z26 TaxID=2500177 RepID=UPI000EF13650|nr:acyltransferase domain-containing protein [Streptomyces sp. Z26]RLL66853.1 hypothetical protein D7M15_08245 [Streptomyces sp. Z26]
MPETDPATVERSDWLAALGARAAEDVPHGGPPPPSPPTAAELADRTRLLAVPDVDRAAVLATFPDPARTPRRWQALLRCHRTLFADADADASPPTAADWPDAPPELGAYGRYFYVHLYLLALPYALREAARRGVPDDVLRATFADLGAKLTSYRAAYGTGGLDRQTWLVRHFRGTLHRLGRLQFERTAHRAATHGDTAATGGPADGAPVLAVHIPGDGPLSPDLCDASFRAARPFHARHFPGEPYAYATCHSWLLDEQLAARLRGDANILAFQRRFHLHGDRPVCDDDVLEFVFRTPPRATADGLAVLDTLPRTSTLQRVLTAHLREGHHWRLGHGWLPLP